MDYDHKRIEEQDEAGFPGIASIVPQRQRLSDFVFDALCESIVKGVLKPGQRLREASIALRLEVSRTPVREAFTRLEMQHLLERDPNGAYLVATWTPQIMREVANLRGMLEGFAAQLACKKLEPADFDYLQSLIMQMEAATLRKDYEALIDLDIQFHSTIWERSGHTLLLEMLESMKSQIRYFMYLTRPGDEDTYGSEHQILTDILREGDPDKGALAIKKHILDTAAQAIERMVI